MIASPAAPHAPNDARESGATLYGLYMLAVGGSLTGNLLIRIGARMGWLPSWAQIALALLASLPLAVAAVVFWRMVRRHLDEMFQRIVFEGMALALSIFLPLTALCVNLRTAGVWLPRLDPPDLLLMPALLVALGVEVSRRRYQ